MMHLLACLILLFCAVPADAAPFDPFKEATVTQHPGAQVPIDGVFRDQNGRSTTLRKLAAGRPILLAPVLHDCPNFCGVTLDGLAAALKRDGIDPRRDVQVVAFGIDPKEGPVEARRQLATLGKRYPAITAHMTALTGPAPAIHKVTDALDYHYAFDPRIGQYAHVAAVAVLTPEGKLVQWLFGVAPDPTALKAATADAQAGRTGGIVEALILCCYHYDPETGRYTLAIGWIIRVLAGATVAALALYILRARRREKRKEARPC